MDAFGNARHLGVAMPVELLTRRDDNKKQRELFLPFDGESHNTGGYLHRGHDLVEFGHLDFVDLSGQKFEVIGLGEGLRVVVIVPVGDVLDQP